MKKILITCILVTLSCISQFSFGKESINKGPWRVHQSVSNVITIENVDEGWVLIKPRNTKLVFLGEGISATQLRQAQEASLVINAGYFGYADEVTKRPFVPAGSYPYSSETLPDDLPCDRDMNLCGRINAQTLKIQTQNNSVEKNVLNAGPMLLEEGKVNTAVIGRRSHRLTPNYRTVLINSNSYGNFFFVSTEKRTLFEVASMIQKRFPKATAINLDGGSSTSWSSSRGGWNSKKILPTYFVLK